MNKELITIQDHVSWLEKNKAGNSFFYIIGIPKTNWINGAPYKYFSEISNATMYLPIFDLKLKLKLGNIKLTKTAKVKITPPFKETLEIHDEKIFFVKRNSEELSFFGFIEQNSSFKNELSEYSEPTSSQEINDRKISEIISNSKFTDLLLKDATEELLSLMSIKKVDIFLENLYSLINSNSIEKKFENLFLKNKWIFNIILSIEISRDENNFATQKELPSKRIIDVLIKGKNNSALIEFKNSNPIKMPRKRERKHSDDTYGVMSEITSTIVQTSQYHQEISELLNKMSWPANSPEQIIIGWTKSELNEEQLNSFEHFRSQINIPIITYDEIISKLRNFKNNLNEK